MIDKPQNQELQEKLTELEEYLSKIKDVKEWKRAEAVRLRLIEKSYEEIQNRLGVSISFIAKSQKKYLEKGISGLKLEYQGSKPYLTPSQLKEIEQGLIPIERRNISELERHLIEEYDVVFKSPQSYYQILRDSQLSWQKGNKENPKKKPR